jgi:hypothetical protein
MWQNAVRDNSNSRDGTRSDGGRDDSRAGGGSASKEDKNKKTGAQAKPQFRDTCAKIVGSKFLVALVVGLFTATLLIVLNPPIAHVKSEDGETVKRSPVRIAAWSSISSLIALCLPYANTAWVKMSPTSAGATVADS